jgi:hypothetical protein
MLLLTAEYRGSIPGDFMRVSCQTKWDWNTLNSEFQHSSLLLFSLWLYSPILDLGRLHETFRFISVSRSRTVGWTPWTGDQLVARTLLTAPVECDYDGEIGGMNSFGRGNRSTHRKPATTPLCPPQIPLVRSGREPRLPRWEARD